MLPISSLQNPTIKLIRSLEHKKERRDTGLFVAEGFTGQPGRYVPLKDTIRSFKELIEGKHDTLPEQAFFMAGGIDDVVANAERMAKA